MARSNSSTVVTWKSCEGRNHWDSPLDVPDDMGVEAVNVTLRRGGLGTKRPGSSTVTLTGDAYSGINHLAKFIPGQDLTLAELFLFSNDAKIIRVSAGAVAQNLTLADNIATRPQDVTTAMLNGKLFIAYDSTVNRLHVFSPSESTTTVRRAGLAPPVAATVANTGSGTYAATLRYYRIQYRVKSGSTILRQSNLGPSVSFTPSGTGTAARVTKPATINEGETHWVIHGSADDAVYYELAEVVVGTTTYDDTETPSAYNVNEASPLEGSFYPFPSVKFLISDGTRLFGLGAWETSAGDSVTVRAGTLYWTPPLFSSEAGSTIGVGDDERTQATIVQDDRLELSVNAGGVDRGLVIFMNDVYCFQSKGIIKAVATGDATAPFRRVMVSRDYGAISHASLVIGEDELGNPALYFLDPVVGPCRYTVTRGIQWLGKDVNDIWQRVNQSATIVVSHGVYDRKNKRVLWWAALDAEQEPTTKVLTYYVTMGRVESADDISVRRGWAEWTGGIAAARTSLMFPKTLASPRPLVETPYVANTTSFRNNDGTLNTDSTVAYQGYVQSKAYDWGIIVRRKRITESYITADARAATSIQQTITTDVGAQAITESASIAPAGSETMVRPRLGGTDVADAICVQVTLGDASALDNTWSLNRWDGVVAVQEGAQ